MLLRGQLRDLEATGTELQTEGPGSVLVTAGGEAKGRICHVHIRLGEATVGREAYVTLAAAE
jgi:hypothetical protein